MGISTRMQRGWFACGASLLLSLFHVAPAFSEGETAAVSSSEIQQRITKLFEGAERRLPGSPGNLIIEQRVADIFAATGFEHGDLKFTAPCFEAGAASFSWAGGAAVPMQAMHPTLIRPGNFEETDFNAPVVYVGRGTQEDLKRLDGVDLKGCIALMDFDCGPDWLRFLRFGVKGFLFMGADSYTHYDAAAKVSDTEVAIPRYFVSASDGKALKSALDAAGGKLTLSIHAEPSCWVNKDLRDLWVMVPGADPKLTKEVVFIVAPLDSNGVVPSESQSPGSGVNLDLMLDMLRQYSTNPPARTVLFAAVNGHTERCLGERVLAWFSIANQGAVEGLRDDMAKDIRLQELYVKTYSQLKLDGLHNEQDAALVTDLRTTNDVSTGKVRPLKKPIQDLAKSDVSRIKEKRINLPVHDLSKEQLAAAQAELSLAQTNHTKVLTLFNKFGATPLSELNAAQLQILRGYAQEIVKRNGEWAALNHRDLDRDMTNGVLSARLSGMRVVMIYCLNFNWHSDRIGLSSDNYWGFSRWAYDFGRRVMAQVGVTPELAEGGRTNRIVDTLTNLGGLPEGHFFPPTDPGMSSCPQLAVFMSARNPVIATFGLENVYADVGSAFTPADTFAALDYAQIALLYDVAPRFLKMILNDPEVTLSSCLKDDYNRPGTGLFSKRVMTFQFDEFSSDQLPTLPVPGSLIIGQEVEYDGIPRLSPIIGSDIINAYFAKSDDRCAAYLYGIRNDSPDNKYPIYSSIYHLKDDQRTIDFALDAGEKHSHVSSFIGAGSSMHVGLFPCVELPIAELNDSSYISTDPIRAPEGIVYDAARDSAPQRYGYTGFQSPLSSRYAKDFPVPMGPAAVYAESDTDIKFLKGGNVGILRTLLNSSTKEPNGEGYSVTNPIPSDVFGAIAKDMSYLNEGKIRKLSGISDVLITGFQLEGSNALAEAAAAGKQNRHLSQVAAAYRALGAEVKAYEQARGMADDMLKAVVFYMALMLPFCFFLQRLLFKTVKIEAQMGIFALLFLLIYIVFRLIHPAFKIAQAPEAMFIAFVMGALGFFVIHILRGRFEGEMQFIFRTLVVSDVADVGAGAVGGQAMLIGVNNMKRRRIRTALTTGTIILVTFTMLAFTSVSKKLSPTVISKSKFAPYTGVMFHWPNSPMDEGTLQVFRDLAADTSSFETKSSTVIERWWLTAPRQDLWGQQSITPFRLETAATDGGVTVEAFIGMLPEEDGFLEKLPILDGGRFFSSRDAMEMVLPASVADALNIVPADAGRATIRFRGHDFKVVGILNDERFRAMADIDGSPLVPVKGAAKKAFGASSTSDDSSSRTGITYYDTSSLALMPVDTCRRFGGEPYSISIRLGDAEPVWPIMNRLLTISSAKFFMSSRVPFKVGDEGKRTATEGVYYVGSNYRTSIGGLAKLIVPLLIASTIILNTMLGSVFERKAEIAIYNAVGLNPTHIGLFFLAESFVFSVIGSVGGYLIGQVLSLLLNRYGLISDINLNFSSLSVVYVILFTIAVVLLSTLYPAIVATRAAVPSGKRKWSMPSHDGNSMALAFPFIYEERLLVGIMNYVREYFANFSEASVGNMTAESRGMRKSTDASGRPVYELEYLVALAPYDLGVTQTVHLKAAYDEKVRANRITMVISRQSGQDSNWLTTNKPFLEKLRKYLMHWRNMKAADHAVHVEQGRSAFAQG